MLRLPLILALPALAIQSTPSASAPLKPSDKWVVDYTPSSCTARRTFGDHAILIVPSPLGSSTRVIIDGPGRALRARQFPSMVDPDDGRGAVKASSLIYPFKAAKGRRGIYSVLPNDLVTRILLSGKIDIRAGKLESRLIWSDRSATPMGAALEIGGGASLNKALDTCMADLRKYWGMIDGQLPVPAIANQPTGDVRGVFRHEDYPDDAITAGQSGNTSFTLMIDERGGVMDCAVRESSGVATLDAMGCQVLRERARFISAKDAAGKPVKSVYLTPPIRWVLQ
ncbi:MAG: energy transducer TonB [Pseudomonadota bacterium]